MKDIIRRSPVVFKKKAAKKEMRGDWDVVLAYENEGEGPFLIDLSHMTRWDLQDGDLDRLKPWDITIPNIPGEAVFKNDILINRMNRTQASIWNLNGGNVTEPDDRAYTETTDATVCLAMLGKNILSIAEKVSALDFSDPEKPDPCLFQGPFNHVPCQITRIDKSSEEVCLFLTCSRGYSRDMIHGLLEAGSEFNLEPAGEAVFSNWLRNRMQKT
jgi:hypothetical protein